MSIQLTSELENQSSIQTLAQAVDVYKRQVEATLRRTKDHLHRFEQQYKVTTDYFLREMAAEDLVGGDWEYVKWAGEARLLQGLETELRDLEHTPSSIDVGLMPILTEVLDEIRSRINR